MYSCIYLQGHAENDRAAPEGIPLTHRMEAIADTDGDGVISNLELYNALDPTNVNGMDYVFDNFKWEHCQDMVESERR